jgi:hypothetical protein
LIKVGFHETLPEVSVSGVDADIDNYRTTFMCSTMVSVTTTGQRSTPVIAPMATSQRLNALVTI